MAEVVAGVLTSAIVKIAGDKLSSAITEQTNLALNFKTDFEYMRDTMESMEAVSEDAEKQSVKNKLVRLWLNRLKDAAVDISDMMDDYQETPKEKIGMFSCLTAASKKMILANKMKKMREKLERINKERRDFTFAETNPASQDQQLPDERETKSDVKKEEIFGRDVEKKNIMEFLSSSHSKDGVMVISIHGLGGIGKSTMAKLIYNDTQLEKYYHHWAWVYVSQAFDVKKIGNSIISQLVPTEGQQNRDTLQLVQQCLNDLLHGKKILIILDDIWEEDNFKLKELKDMLDKKGSMIDVIVTTRSESIANKICTKAYKLQPLEDDVCWDIIKRYSGFEYKSNKGELKKIGLDIAKKCGGVPLAAQAVGYMLRSKDPDGWKEVNNSDIWNEYSGVGNSKKDMKVLPSLKLSYERMIPILRLCFSYCAIFPKGHEIFEDDLVHQWFALGFIKKPSDGKEYINQLLGMSFLQYSKLGSELRGARYTMHDLATSVTNDQLTTIDASQKTSSNTREHKYCRYALLTNYDGKAKLSDILPEKVRALHFASSSKLLASREGSLSFAKCLRILDLSGCSGTTLLPYSIGQLKKLRCLIAPQVQDTKLPESIAKLSKLQYINLQKSPLMSALPESFGEMKNLLYLDMSLCSRISVLPESFGRLKSLTELYMIDCSRITGLPEAFGGLKSLTHFDMKGCSGITGLPESFGGLKSLTKLYMRHCSGITALPESFSELKSLTELYIIDCSGITSLPESFGGLKSLKNLNMEVCSGITGLPESIGELKSLTELYMNDCFGITGLPESFGGLKSLTKLCMRHCSGIAGLPESFGGLKSLTHLYMQGCSRITGLPESFGGLKSLTHLDMIDCSRIIGLPKSFGGLKSLTNLYMQGYSEITVLPKSFGELKSLTKLYMIDCSGITSLPKSFGGLKSLTELYMSNCPGISGLPKSFGGLQSLTELCMIDCYGITGLPESFGGLKSLTKLCMIDCSGITGLPESFGGLKSLTKLFMIDCSGITGLPESFGGLENLIHLNMVCCSGITGLPESFGELKSLTNLDMRGSGITGLPKSFGELKSLTELYIIHCSGITDLPESFGELKSLTHLDMRYCSGITGLPESFGGLKSLTHLDMRYCSGITGLPETFGGSESLIHLNMEGCSGITGLQESFGELKN